MDNTQKRATIYFDSALHRALRLKTAETDQSLSDPVNEAVKLSLAEDAEDLAAFDNRAIGPELLFESVSGSLFPGTGQVRQEHLPGFVGDHEFNAGSLRYRLRCHSAAPEDRYFSRVDRNRLAVVRPAQVADPDRIGVADVDRCAVRVRVA